MIRKQKIVSGRLLELNYYPVYCDGRRYPSRAPKTNLSTDEQARYNRKQAQKKLIRLICRFVRRSRKARQGVTL